MVLEVFSHAKWFERSYHKENDFRGLVSHTKWVQGLITRRTILEGDHRSFSNIQTKISRHTIYFGVVIWETQVKPTVL